MMQLEQEVFLVAVCKLNPLQATSMQALSQRGVGVRDADDVEEEWGRR